MNNLCHRDIKLENFMFDNNFNLKLIDYEFCKPNRIFSDICGTRAYMAAEFYYKRNDMICYRGDQVDIFSTGVLLFAILTGVLPFRYADMRDKHYRYMFDNCDKFWEMRKIDIPQSAKELISLMITPNPKERIDLKGIKKSDFYNDSVVNDVEACNYMHQIWLMVELNKNKKV
jgi:serine/threonine protein kinase